MRGSRDDGSGADAPPEDPVRGTAAPSPAPERAAVRSTKPSIPDRCFKALVARYRVSTAFLDLAASTRAEYERHIRHLEPAIGLSAVAAFTADHMDRIMSKYPDDPALRQAIRRTVSVMLTYAARTLKWIPSNPLMRTDKPRKRQQEGQKPFTEPEIARYRKRHPSGSRERLGFEIGLATAFRREDICRVKGEDILAGLIPLLTSKAGVLVLAPVTRHLLAAYLAFLDRHPAAAGSRYALGCQKDGRPIHKRTLSGFMKAAFEAAGFDRGQRIHALRYTAAVRLFERNFSFGDIAEQTGHRMAIMAQKYCEKRRGAHRRELVFEGFDDALDDLVDEAFRAPEQPNTLMLSRAPVPVVALRKRTVPGRKPPPPRTPLKRHR
jgi:integrase